MTAGRKEKFVCLESEKNPEYSTEHIHNILTRLRKCGGENWRGDLKLRE